MSNVPLSYLERAEQSCDNGDISTAIKYCKKAIERDTGANNARLLLASIYGGKDLLDKAILLVDQVLSENPALGSAYLIKGYLVLAADNRQLALKCFETAVSLNPHDMESRCALANFLMEMGDIDKSIEEFTVALSIDSENQEILNILGALFQNAGEWDTAISYYEQLDKLQTDDISAHLRVSEILSTKGDHYGAQEFLLSPVNTESAPASYYSGLAEIYLAQGLHCKALDFSRRASAISENEQEYLFQQADILERWGDYEAVYEIIRDQLEPGDYNIQAVLLFSRISYLIDMSEQAKTLVESALSSCNLSLEMRTIMEAALLELKKTCLLNSPDNNLPKVSQRS